MSDIAQWIEPVCDLARVAGERILEVYETDFDVIAKADDSPVTRADMAAHKVIEAGLKEIAPDIPVLSEESSRLPYSERKTWGRYWLVDPLDGTREFIKRNGEFTVNIALIDNDAPIMGVVYVPITQDMYYASEGAGAYLHRHGSESARKLSVAPANKEQYMVAGSRSHPGERLKLFLERLENYELVSLGSSLKFCRVAEGMADIYVRLGLTSEWDTGAAQCVVEEAGGKVRDIDGNRLSYNQKDSLLNPEFVVYGDDSVDWLSFVPPKN